MHVSALPAPSAPTSTVVMPNADWCGVSMGVRSLMNWYLELPSWSARCDRYTFFTLKRLTDVSAGKVDTSGTCASNSLMGVRACVALMR